MYVYIYMYIYIYKCMYIYIYCVCICMCNLLNTHEHTQPHTHTTHIHIHTQYIYIYILCVYMSYIYLYVYILCVCVYVQFTQHTWTRTAPHAFTHSYTVPRVCLRAYVFVFVCTCACACMHVCVYFRWCCIKQLGWSIWRWWDKRPSQHCCNKTPHQLSTTTFPTPTLHRWMSLLFFGIFACCFWGQPCCNIIHLQLLYFRRQCFADACFLVSLSFFPHIIHCNTLQQQQYSTPTFYYHVFDANVVQMNVSTTHRQTLQHTATHRNTLQHTATLYNKKPCPLLTTVIPTPMLCK